MPEISRFNGIVIRIYHDDHPPAHFHALTSDGDAQVGIETLSVLNGKLAGKRRRQVMTWARLRQSELRVAWQLAQAQIPPGKIAPL